MGWFERRKAKKEAKEIMKAFEKAREDAKLKGAQQLAEQRLYGTNIPTDRVSVLQKRVLDQIAPEAKKFSDAATKQLETLLKKFGFKTDDLKAVREQIRKSELNINFKPGKFIGKRELVEVMAESAYYKNAFEIGFSGGEQVNYGNSGRNQVEISLFNYPAFSSPVSPADSEKKERPRYIGLNILDYGLGAAGDSSYGATTLVLKNYVRKWCTLTCCDTFGVGIGNTNKVGNFAHFDHVIYHQYEKLGAEDFKKWFGDVLANARHKRKPTLDPVTRKRLTQHWSYWEAQAHCIIKYPDDIMYLRGGFCEDFGRKSLQDWAVLEAWPLIWAWNDDEMFLDPILQFKAMDSQMHGRYNLPKSIGLQKFEEFWAERELIINKLIIAAVEARTRDPQANVDAISMISYKDKTRWDAIYNNLPPALKFKANG